MGSEDSGEGSAGAGVRPSRGTHTRHTIETQPSAKRGAGRGGEDVRSLWITVIPTQVKKHPGSHYGRTSVRKNPTEPGGERGVCVSGRDRPSYLSATALGGAEEEPQGHWERLHFMPRDKHLLGFIWVPLSSAVSIPSFPPHLRVSKSCQQHSPARLTDAY